MPGPAAGSSRRSPPCPRPGGGTATSPSRASVSRPSVQRGHHQLGEAVDDRVAGLRPRVVELRLHVGRADDELGLVVAPRRPASNRSSRRRSARRRGACGRLAAGSSSSVARLMSYMSRAVVSESSCTFWICRYSPPAVIHRQASFVMNCCLGRRPEQGLHLRPGDQVARLGVAGQHRLPPAPRPSGRPRPLRRSTRPVVGSACSTAGPGVPNHTAAAPPAMSTDGQPGARRPSAPCSSSAACSTDGTARRGSRTPPTPPAPIPPAPRRSPAAARRARPASGGPGPCPASPGAPGQAARPAASAAARASARPPSPPPGCPRWKGAFPSTAV